MRFVRTAAYPIVLVFAASLCCTNHTPPAPVISGPDSGFVNVPVEFTASYVSEWSNKLNTWWHWGGAEGVSFENSLVVQHTYADTGTYLVWATALYVYENFLDQMSFYDSDSSNLCTLRILPAPARTAKP